MKRIPKKMIIKNKVIESQFQEVIKMHMETLTTSFMINDFNLQLLSLFSLKKKVK